MSACLSRARGQRRLTTDGGRIGRHEDADIRRLRELEDDNHGLKQIYTDLSLKNRARRFTSRVWLSRRQACAAVGLQRSVYQLATPKL